MRWHASVKNKVSRKQTKNWEFGKRKMDPMDQGCYC